MRRLFFVLGVVMAGCSAGVRSPDRTLAVEEAGVEAAAPAESARVRYDLAPGAARTYRRTVIWGMELGGTGHYATLREAALWRFTPEASSGGGVSVRVEPVAMKGASSLPMVGAMYYDTTSPEKPDATPMYAEVVGKSARVEMTESGRVLSVAKSPELAAVAQRMDGGKDFDQMFGDDKIRNVVAECFPQLPEEGVRPGDTWVENRQGWSEGVGGAISFATTWMCTRVNDLDGRETAWLEGNVAIALPAGADEREMPGGIKMRRVLRDASGHVSARMDVRPGRLRRLRLMAHIPETMTMTTTALASMESINSLSTVDVEVTLVEQGAAVDPDGLVRPLGGLRLK
jgi:hypothetical protein